MQESIFLGLEGFVTSAMEFIDILEIGSLNSVAELSQVIHEEVTGFLQDFPQILG